MYGADEITTCLHIENVYDDDDDDDEDDDDDN